MPYSSISEDKDSDIFENNAETDLLLLAKGPCLTAPTRYESVGCDEGEVYLPQRSATCRP